MSSVALSADELIDDRALESVEDDRFDHKDFVAELGRLAGAVRTPANIALYAPWGSGKSGLAHMLEEHFKGRPDVRFVRFDALKYAEAPLRRQFVLKLAGELGTPHPEFYATTTGNTIDIPREKVAKLVLLFIAALAGLMAAVFFGSAVYGLVARGPAADRFHDALAWSAPKAFLPAVLLGAVAALLGNQFKVETKVEAPSSAEQFEAAFCRLVLDAVGVAPGPGCPSKIDDKKRRLVVFIDELDRCSPTEVASVLETLRTFLEVKGCVFIVAADQHALEEALSQRVKQATPGNAVAPYYSAGSAYLDKIFQFQMSLPPLKPQRLTSFALQLVDDKRGVWDRVRKSSALEDVISVLIPTHVDSPRRVKALLNNFALLYRLAELRAASGKLGPEISSRATELAKLACLRLEFPLFAADFSLDARMPELVRRAIDGERLPTHLRPEVAERVKLWAEKKLAVDELLFTSSGRDVDGTTETELAQAELQGASGTLNPPSLLDGADRIGQQRVTTTDLVIRERVQAEHAEQLLRYLRKTAQVPGPGRDLIHLESAAATIEGIDPASADELERAAVDGEIATIRELMAGLDGDAQRAGVLLLAHIVGHSAVGVEGDNAVRTLLSALGVCNAELGNAADRAAVAISTHRYTLSPEDLPVVLELAGQCDHVAGSDLRARALSNDAVLTELDVQIAVLKAAGHLLEEDPSRLSAIVAAAVVISGAEIAEALVELDEPTALQVIDLAGPELRLEDPETGDLDGHRIDQLGEALYVLAGDSGRRSLSDRLAAVLLETGVDPAIDAVHWQLDKLRATRDARLARSAIDCAGSRPRKEIGAWLGVVSPAAISAHDAEALQPLISERIAELWRAYLSGDASTADMARLAEALKPFARSAIMPDVDSMPEDVYAALGSLVHTGEAATERREQLSVAMAHSELGLLRGARVAGCALHTVQAAVAGGHASGIRDDLVSMLAEYRLAADSDAIETLRDTLAEDEPPVWSAGNPTWVIKLSAQLEGERSALPYDTAQIRSLVSLHGLEFQEGLAAWISFYVRDADELLEGIAPILQAAPPEIVADALRRQVDQWRERDGEQVDAFVRGLATGLRTGRVHRDWFKAARAELAGSSLTTHLAEIYEAGADAERTRQLLDVWEVMRVEDDKQIREFCRRVLVPMVRSRDEATYRVAKDFIPQLKDLPADRRRVVRDHLRDRAKQFRDGTDLEDRFKRAGLKRSSLLRGPKDL